MGKIRDFLRSDLFHLVSIWSTLGPNLTTLLRLFSFWFLQKCPWPLSWPLSWSLSSLPCWWRNKQKDLEWSSLFLMASSPPVAVFVFIYIHDDVTRWWRHICDDVSQWRRHICDDVFVYDLIGAGMSDVGRICTKIKHIWIFFFYISKVRFDSLMVRESHRFVEYGANFGLIWVQNGHPWIGVYIYYMYDVCVWMNLLLIVCKY